MSEELEQSGEKPEEFVAEENGNQEEDTAYIQSLIGKMDRVEENKDESLENTAKQSLNVVKSDYFPAFFRKVDQVFPLPNQKDLFLVQTADNVSGRNGSSRTSRAFFVMDQEGTVYNSGKIFREDMFSDLKSAEPMPEPITDFTYKSYSGVEPDSFEQSSGWGKDIVESRFAGDDQFVLVAEKNNKYSARTIETHGEHHIYHNESSEDQKNEHRLDYIILDFSEFDQDKKLTVVRQMAGDEVREEEMNLKPFIKSEHSKE